MNNPYAPELQVKQFVGVVKNQSGLRFMVFRTGSERHYLFCPLIGDSMICSGLQIPVLKSDLRRDIKHALAAGYGNSL